MTHME